VTQIRDYGGLRRNVMANARRRVHELAGEGLSSTEIDARVNGSLTRTERELLRVFTRSEVAAARRGRVADSLEPGSGWLARHEIRSMFHRHHGEKTA
jgi:hypothetical protein